MEVTMTNETEYVFDRTVGRVTIYDDTTRLTDGRAAVIYLEAGITSSETALLEKINPDDVTHRSFRLLYTYRLLFRSIGLRHLLWALSLSENPLSLSILRNQYPS